MDYLYYKIYKFWDKRARPYDRRDYGTPGTPTWNANGFIWVSTFMLLTGIIPIFMYYGVLLTGILFGETAMNSIPPEFLAFIFIFCVLVLPVLVVYYRYIRKNRYKLVIKRLDRCPPSFFTIVWSTLYAALCFIIPYIVFSSYVNRH